MDGAAWQATVHSDAESDMTEATQHTYASIVSLKKKKNLENLEGFTQSSRRWRTGLEQGMRQRKVKEENGYSRLDWTYGTWECTTC